MIHEHLTEDGRVWDRTVALYNGNQIFDVHFGGGESDRSQRARKRRRTYEQALEKMGIKLLGEVS